MAHVPEVVLDLYNGIPKDSLVSSVPLALRGHEDNEVIPSHDHTHPGPDGAPSKWIRFCDFPPFIDACKSYWMGSLHLDYPLYVYVMPYTPVSDAFYLHELIDNPQELPEDDSFIEDMAVQPSGAEAPHLKEGKVEVPNGEYLSFFVVNYSLLYSKAHNHRVLSYVTNPFREGLRRLHTCDDLLPAGPPAATSEQLVLAAENAKRRLALVLMDKYAGGDLAANPHDALLAMFPEIHDDLYQLQCQCHHPEPDDQQDPPAARIESAKQVLGYGQDGELSIGQAERNLLNSGVLELHNLKTNARARLTTAVDPAIDSLRVASTSHSLMGVIANYEDGNPDEGN